MKLFYDVDRFDTDYLADAVQFSMAASQGGNSN